MKPVSQQTPVPQQSVPFCVKSFIYIYIRRKKLYHNIQIVYKNRYKYIRQSSLFSDCFVLKRLLLRINFCTDLNINELASSFSAVFPNSNISTVGFVTLMISFNISCLISLKAGHSSKKCLLFSTAPQEQYGSATIFLAKRCSYKALQWVLSRT